jgi:hypothetical protein
MDTNKILLTEDDIFMMEGRTNGFVPSDEQLKSARATAKAMNMEKMRAMGESLNPTNIATYNTATNEVTGRVYEVGRDSRGRIVERLEPDVRQTTDGFQQVFAPGVMSDYMNMERGNTPKGYAASDSFYGLNQPVVGGAPSASPTPTPSPAPSAAAKPLTMTNAEGRVMTFNNPYDARAAYKRGELTDEEAVAATLHFRRP